MKPYQRQRISECGNNRVLGRWVDDHCVYNVSSRISELVRFSIQNLIARSFHFFAFGSSSISNYSQSLSSLLLCFSKISSLRPCSLPELLQIHCLSQRQALCELDLTGTRPGRELTLDRSSWLGGPLINCLSDSQAGQIVNAFESILTNPNRQQANKTAQALIANNYQEISDSINSLAGFPLGSVTFNGKTAFINGVVGAPAIQGMSTLSIYHDCTHITWRWLVTGLGSKAQEVKGINVMTINNQGQLIESDIEFNSIAWGWFSAIL